MPSPISRRTNAEPLSLELLRTHVPVVKKGYEAIKALQNEEAQYSRPQLNELLRAKQDGSKSQEILIVSALPLIKNITSREFQRRRSWNSRVSFDDLLQEAIAGFIRGLLSYNEQADHNSPTNYLGQWITTSIRRKTEQMEHDFTIPYEVVERARRIRAVQSRLINELERNPTDEELLVALNDPNDQNKGAYKWGGRKTEDGSSKRGGITFTQAHLQEARDLSNRAYSLVSNEESQTGDDESFEQISTPLTIDESPSTDTFEAQNLRESRIAFFEQAFITMKIGSKQKDIVLRFFGMYPYSGEQTQKEIIKETALPSRFVKSVILSFQTYMPHRGGVFHQIISRMEPDEIDALEFGFLVPLLGDWPDGKKIPDMPPSILTQMTLKTTQKSLDF